jgi:hypothetical protein
MTTRPNAAFQSSLRDALADAARADPAPLGRKDATPAQPAPTLLRDLSSVGCYAVFMAVLVTDGIFKITCGSACKPYAHWTDALLPAAVLPLITAGIAYRFMGGAGIVRRLLAAVCRARQY